MQCNVMPNTASFPAPWLEPRPPAQWLVSTLSPIRNKNILLSRYPRRSLFNVLAVVYGNLRTLCLYSAYLLRSNLNRRLKRFVRMLAAFYITLSEHSKLSIAYIVFLHFKSQHDFKQLLNVKQKTYCFVYLLKFFHFISIRGSYHWSRILMFPWQLSPFFKSWILLFLMNWKINFLALTSLSKLSLVSDAFDYFRTIVSGFVTPFLSRSPKGDQNLNTPYTTNDYHIVYSTLPLR